MVALIALSFASCKEEKLSFVEQIKKEGKLIVLTASGFAPFEYLDEQGNVTGVDMEISKAIADKLGVTLEIVDMDFNSIVDSLKNGKGHIAAAGMSARPDREEQIDFSDSYYNTQLSVVAKTGSGITPETIGGKKIAFQQGTTSHSYLDENYADNSELLSFNYNADAIAALNSGNAECVVMDTLTAQNFVTVNAGALEIVGVLETGEEEIYCIGIPEGEKEFQTIVNEVINEMVSSGKIDELVDYHNEKSAAQ